MVLDIKTAASLGSYYQYQPIYNNAIGMCRGAQKVQRPYTSRFSAAASQEGLLGTLVAMILPRLLRIKTAVAEAVAIPLALGEAWTSKDLWRLCVGRCGEGGI